VLSDIAAMGGDPLWLLLDVTAPTDLPVDWLEAAFAGLSELAERHGAAVVGGDMSCSHALAFHVFGVGRVETGKAVLRSRAGRHDRVYVTGSLGGSLRGKHLAFEPRLAEGAWLGRGGWASAMIDVSDGVATDLHHLVRASGVQAEIRAADLPCTTGVNVEHALRDGEDYELLFTVPEERHEAFEVAWREAWALPCTCIGRTLEGEASVTLLMPDGTERTVRPDGYEHFKH
jgi:thiamine-monophosphate kinase